MDSSSRDPFLAGGGWADASGRTRDRDSLFLLARLTVADERGGFDVRVRNLSEGGLMVEFDRPLAEGSAVTLTLRGLGDVAGRVAWCAEGRIGVAFDRRIDPMLARKPVGKGAGTPVYAKPQLGGVRR